LKNKRILIDARCLTAHMHGIARVALRFIENAVRIAPDNSYVVLTGTGTPAALLPKAPCLNVETTGTKLYGLAERFVIPRIIKRIAPDLYYSPTCFAPSRAACPVVFSIYDLIYISAPSSGSLLRRIYFNTVVKKAAKNAARVITDSNYVARELNSRLGIPEKKIRTVYLGVDESFGDAAKSPDVETPYILNVSNRFPHKNTAALLRAFEILLEKGLRGYKLIVVGEQNAAVRDVAGGERLRPHVELAGHVDDERLAGLMRGASLFVLPSRYEGFGLPVLEAARAGVPVVAGDNTAVAELFRDCACLVDMDSPPAIAGAMERILADGEERRRMAARGLEIAKKFSWEKMTRDVLSVFDEVLEGK